MDITGSGEWLKNLRSNNLGMTQDDFAQLLNKLTGRRYDRNKISRWENNGHQVPLDIQAEVAIYLTKMTKRDSARVVTVALQKGGVGKTTLAVNLGYILTKTGGRVLLVDADSQSNLTAYVGYGVQDVANLGEHTHYEALTGRRPVRDVIHKTSVQNLDVIPAHVGLALAERELTEKYILERDTKPHDMKNMLQPVLSEYDYIIIDAPPSLGVMTINCLCAADRVLIPVQCEPFSLMGLHHLCFGTIEQIQYSHNPDLQILAFVPTLWDSRGSGQTQEVESLQELKSTFGHLAPVLPAIPRSANYTQTSARALITLQAEPATPGIMTYVEIARILGGSNNGY